MRFRIQWVRAPAIVLGLILVVARTMPASASADGTKKVGTFTHLRTTASVPSRAKTEAGRAHGKALIFGNGDGEGGGIPPTEPITDLENILTNAGYGVDVSATLPTKLGRYKVIWYVGTNSVSSAHQAELEAFVNSGRGLYLTGTGPSSETLDDASDTSMINGLVAGGGVQAGGQGAANDPTAPELLNPDAIDDVGAGGGSWTPNDPGGMTGVTGDNVLTSTEFGDRTLPTGAVWNASDMTDGKGRLAILMDIVWTGPGVVGTIERFLTDQ
jgi:hypothetical protein